MICLPKNGDGFHQLLGACVARSVAIQSLQPNRAQIHQREGSHPHSATIARRFGRASAGVVEGDRPPQPLSIGRGVARLGSIFPEIFLIAVAAAQRPLLKVRFTLVGALVSRARPAMVWSDHALRRAPNSQGTRFSTSTPNFRCWHKADVIRTFSKCLLMAQSTRFTIPSIMSFASFPNRLVKPSRYRYAY
jgi:hypothetical protein